jgi:hypothetical protein
MLQHLHFLVLKPLSFAHAITSARLLEQTFRAQERRDELRLHVTRTHRGPSGVREYSPVRNGSAARGQVDQRHCRRASTAR